MACWLNTWDNTSKYLDTSHYNQVGWCFLLAWVLGGSSSLVVAVGQNAAMVRAVVDYKKTHPKYARSVGLEGGDWAEFMGETWRYAAYDPVIMEAGAKAWKTDRWPFYALASMLWAWERQYGSLI